MRILILFFTRLFQKLCQWKEWSLSPWTTSTKTTEKPSQPLGTFDAKIEFYFIGDTIYCGTTLGSEDGILYVADFVDRNPDLCNLVQQSFLVKKMTEEAEFIEYFNHKPVISPRKTFINE